jgi:zinc protease
VGPGNARILVGGDVEPEAVVALLEARLGSWNKAVELTRPEPVPVPIESSVVYFVDEPGASQSVLRLITPTATRMAPDYYDLDVGNRAFGGAFVARVNMNLREDKGWTYGARCFTYYPHGTGFWGCSTSVVREHTADSMKEIIAELDGVLGDNPLSAEEVAYMQSSVKNGYPAGFETTDALLAAQVDIQRYGLPVDWTAKYLTGIAAVTPEGANAALKNAIDPGKLAWFVVGDREQVYDNIAALGIPMIELDREGNPKGE